MAKKKLKTLSDLGVLSKNDFQQKNVTLNLNQDIRSGFQRLMHYSLMWSELEPIRERRARCVDYLNGKQWSELVTVNGRTMTEEAYIKSQGRIPLKNNKIQQVVKNIIGQWRQNPPRAIVTARAREMQSIAEMLTNALEAAFSNNHGDQRDSHLLREFLSSGAAVSKVSYKYLKEKNLTDAVFDSPTIDEMWFNPDLKDPMLDDLTNIGMFVDMTIDKVVSTFAANKDDEYVIRREYERFKNKFVVENQMDSATYRGRDFFGILNNDRVRVYESWELRGEWRYLIHDTMNGTFEAKAKDPEIIASIIAENDRRAKEYSMEGIPLEEIPFIRVEEKFEEFWYYEYMTPSGFILREGETPYIHEEHPFVMTLHPLIDGEVKGFIDDLIDLQRYINRLIITIDFIIASSAKGVLLINEDAVEDLKDLDDVADEWTKFNGVIKLKPKKGLKIQDVAHQFSANNTNIGIFDLLNLQLNSFQQESGVSDAIQGQKPGSGTPFSLYALQSQNSSINLVDTFKTFMTHIQRRDAKMLKTIVQFYDEERYIAVNGTAYSDEAKLYNPVLARNLEWDNKVVEGTSTPVFRQMQDEFLFKLFEAQAIDIKMLLSNSSIPMADKLLDQIEKRELAMQSGDVAPSLPPEMMQALQSGSNPQGMQMIQQLMGGNAA